MLDFGLERAKADFAGAILEMGQQGIIKIYASYLSYANMGYILRDHPTAERYERLFSYIKPQRFYCACRSY